MTAARAVGAVGRFLIGLAVVLLLFAAYQLWGTGIQEARAQSALDDEFAELLAATDELDLTTVTTPPAAAPTTSTVDAPSSSAEAPTTTTPRFDRQAARALFPEGGDPVARLTMDTIGVEKVVIEGVQVEDLRQGPGHYTSTPMPGRRGNAAIAGHRTTYGAPFHDIDQLRPGDPIDVQTVQGTFTYRVLPQPVQSWDGGFCESRARQAQEERTAGGGSENAAGASLPDDYAVGAVDGMHFYTAPVSSPSDDERFAVDAPGHFIISPSDTCVLDDFGDNRLTLTACHPKYSARQRIVVQAVLVSAPVSGPRQPGPSAEPAEGLGPDETPTSTTTSLVDEAEPGDGDDTEALALVATAGGGDDDLTLDGGLSWSWQYLPAALAWTAAALLLWAVARVGARRWRVVPSYLLVTLPLLLVMFLAFEQIDRILPAY